VEEGGKGEGREGKWPRGGTVGVKEWGREGNGEVKGWMERGGKGLLCSDKFTLKCPVSVSRPTHHDASSTEGMTVTSARCLVCSICYTSVRVDKAGT